jgi:hypothetical protein
LVRAFAILLDTRPAYLKGARGAMSLLLAPLGATTVLRHLGEQLDSARPASLAIATDFDPEPEYQRSVAGCGMRVDESSPLVSWLPDRHYGLTCCDGGSALRPQPGLSRYLSPGDGFGVARNWSPSRSILAAPPSVQIHANGTSGAYGALTPTWPHFWLFALCRPSVRSGGPLASCSARSG